MDKRKFEEQLAKAIQNGEGQLIPAKELGMNESDFNVDVEDLYELMYEMYKDACHSEDSLDDRQSYEKHNNNNIAENHFACYGRVGFFQWYAVSLYFDTEIHVMNEEKEHYNAHHLMTMADDYFDGPGECLSKAINNREDLINIIRDPIIANTSAIFNEPDIHIKEMEMHLRRFMKIAISPDKNVFTSKDGKIVFNKEVYKGKDVILPFIYATTKTLDIFGRFAQKLANTGANTVVGIFATRIAPTIDGKEGKITSESRVRSFLPRMKVNIGGMDIPLIF